MEKKKKKKLIIFLSFVLLFISLFVSIFILLFNGYYKVALILFGVLMFLFSLLTSSISTDNEVYIYKKIHENKRK